MNTKHKFNRTFANILSIVAILAIAFPATGSVHAQDEVPTLYAEINFEWVDGWDWPNGDTVALTIKESEGGASIYSDTSIVGENNPDQPNYVRFDVGEGDEPFDVRPGLIVSLKDLDTEVTRTHTVLNIGITDVETSSNIVTGFAARGATLNISAHDPCWQSVEVTANGPDYEEGYAYWYADFTGVCELDTVAFINANQSGTDDINVSTGFFWSPPPPPPDPTLYAEINFEWVDGWDWPNGDTVALTIKESEGGDPIYSDTSIVGENNSDQPNYVRFDVWENGFDVRPGLIISLEDLVTGVTRTHTVLNIGITDVDTSSNLVTGFAARDTTLTITAHDPCWERVEVTADSDDYPDYLDESYAYWHADFTCPLDTVQFINADQPGTDDINVSTGFFWSPPPNPFIAVSLTEHWFWVNNFAPETLITFSIYDNYGDGTPILEFSKPSDALGNLTIAGWEHIWDPAPGDYIVATDGLTTKDLVLEYITLDEFNYGEDFLSGEASAPSRSVDIGVGNENGEQWMNVTADENSRWEADFTLPDFAFDITESSWAGAHVSDEDGDVTAAHNSGPPEPPAWFTAFPEQDVVEAWDFPLGAVVHLAIDDPITDDSPDYEQDETVMFAPWGSWQLWVWFDFAGIYDMKSGDTVTLSYGDTVRTHTVQNLSVTKVEAGTNIVKGTADAGAEIHAWPHATGQEQIVTANPKGKWNVSFMGIYDLMPGDGGRAEIRDEYGNATAVDWYIPRPHIVASITEDWFYLQEFSPNTTINFTVYKAQYGKPIWKGTATTDGSGFAWIDAEGRWDLEPGNYLFVRDGSNSKGLVIEGFTFDVFNLTNGQLSGTAPEPYGRNVWVGIGFENDVWDMEVATDEAGAWFADFGQPVPSDYQWVAAQIFDDDGDASELRPLSIINWTLVVANQSDWVDSGIYINAGQSFTVEAFGYMNPCSDTYPNGADYCIFYTPMGADGEVPYENEFGVFPGPGLSFMALLGRIGDDGEPFYVGADGTFTAEQDGTLWFTPNDNLRTDNQGAYSVLVRLDP